MMWSRDHAEDDRRVGFELGGGARHEMIAERRCPRSGPQELPRHERAGTQPAQLVARAAAERRGPEQPTGHGEIRPAPAPHGTHLEHLSRSERQDLAAGHGRAVDAHLGSGAHNGDVARVEAAQVQAATGDLEGTGAGRPPDQRVGQRTRHRVGRPGARTPTAATSCRPPSWSTARKPGVTTSRTRRAPSGGDHTGGSDTGGVTRSSTPATANWTRSPGARAA